jgi:ABC-2 type transport system ATP-binding protein
MNNMETIIKTTELEFSFGKQKVINKLCLEVPKNSIYGFLGPNGAGKSTTIKLLLGLLHSSENNIHLFDKDLKNNKNDILSKVGNLIESPTIYRNLTASENLLYLNKIYKKESTRIEEVLKIIGLWEHRNKKAKHFSTGMKQRLGIGMAIFHNPELVILDEPVNGLDPTGVFEIRELLLRLQNDGKTIFISSHILSEIEKLCSHVGIIKNGVMLFQGEINSLISKTKKHIEIQTNDNTRAIELLKKQQYSVKTKTNDILEIEVDNQDSFNKLISALVTNQFKIYDIEKKSANLEDIFINLITN